MLCVSGYSVGVSLLAGKESSGYVQCSAAPVFCGGGGSKLKPSKQSHISSFACSLARSFISLGVAVHLACYLIFELRPRA